MARYLPLRPSCSLAAASLRRKRRFWASTISPSLPTGCSRPVTLSSTISLVPPAFVPSTCAIHPPLRYISLPLCESTYLLPVNLCLSLSTISLSIYVYLFVYIHLQVYLSIHPCLPIFVYQSIHLYINLSAHQYIHPSLFLSIYLSIFPSISLSISNLFLIISLSLSLSLSLSIDQSLYQFI